MTETTRCAAALSTHLDPAVATGEAVGSIGDQLGNTPEIVVVLVSGAHRARTDDIFSTIRSLLSPGLLIGSTATGVLGGSQEVETGPGLSVWAATGPGVARAQPFRIEADPIDATRTIGFPQAVEPGSLAVVLADPFTTPIDGLITQLDHADADVSLVGGLASAARAPGGTTMLLDNRSFDSAGVGFVLPPGVARPVVSQGCRPVGSPWVVTEANGNLITELASRPAIERLNELLESFDAQDRIVASRGLNIGIVAEDRNDHFGQGDFLIRTVLGIDKRSAAIAIGDHIEVGQVVQFQLRDGESAHADLERTLEGVTGGGAIVFTCNGRGAQMFGEANHDATIIHGEVAGAVGGMFCAGEIGPIAGRNAIHNYTATLAVFE